MLAPETCAAAESRSSARFAPTPARASNAGQDGPRVLEHFAA